MSISRVIVNGIEAQRITLNGVVWFEGLSPEEQELYNQIRSDITAFDDNMYNSFEVPWSQDRNFNDICYEMSSVMNSLVTEHNTIVYSIRTITNETKREELWTTLDTHHSDLVHNHETLVQQITEDLSTINQEISSLEEERDTTLWDQDDPDHQSRFEEITTRLDTLYISQEDHNSASEVLQTVVIEPLRE